MNQNNDSQQPNENPSTLSSLDDEERKNSKTLIICIDRDDDIGRTGIKTPIVGREACVQAATKLALSDPEEADANAIFGAVRQFDDLVSKGEFCEVVTVSGLYDRGVMGDRKIRSQVAEVLKGYAADGAVLVSDGLEGEELVPVLQSLVPIISIKKIVIKHSGSLEESYAVFGRYLRMLFFDSRYSKYALGVPGVILVTLAIIAYYYPATALVLLAIFVGIVFLIRGFDIDRRIERIGKLSPSGYLRLFSTIASTLIIIVGLATGASIFFPSSTSGVCVTTACTVMKEAAASKGLAVFLYIPRIVGYFVLNSQEFVWLGIGVYMAGALFFNILRPKSRHIARYIVELFVLGLLYFPVSLFANNLVTNGSNGNIDVAIILFALAVNFTIAAYLYSVISGRRRENQSLEVE
jgi:putative membrane protein